MQNVVEKEKKLKIKSLLQLHSAAGSVPEQVFLSEFSEAGTEQCQNAVFFGGKNFSYYAVDSVEHNDTNLTIIIYIAGYAAKKTKGQNSCLSLQYLLKRVE